MLFSLHIIKELLQKLEKQITKQRRHEIQEEKYNQSSCLQIDE